MTRGVNFIPTAFAQRTQRRRHVARWIGINAAIGLLLAIAAAAGFTAGRGAQRLARRLADLERQQADVQARAVEVDAKRLQSAARLETFTAAEHPQCWPRRFASLFESTPEDVSLSAIHVQHDPLPPSIAPTATSKPAARLALSPPPPPETGTIRVLGYAADHDALIEMLTALQAIEGVHDARLVQATRQDEQGEAVLAFELSGRLVEGTP